MEPSRGGANREAKQRLKNIVELADLLSCAYAEPHQWRDRDAWERAAKANVDLFGAMAALVLFELECHD